MTKDIKDIGEKELTKLYAEYQAGLGRPVPAVVHRQGRSIPGCVSAETSAAWRFANKPLEAKWRHRSCVKHYEPNGHNPDGQCDGNEDPGENSQPSTHAVARAVLPVPGVNQSRVWLTSGLP